jgi:hypothetical protein
MYYHFMVPEKDPLPRPGIPGLSSLYGGDFFREWGTANQKYVETANIIARHLHGLFRPRRLADIGSGPGIYATAFRNLGVEVLAIDGVTPPPEYSSCPPDEIRDFREPFLNVWGQFDMTFCFEVVEHIPEEKSATLLANLAQFGDLLILSYAPPHQGGIGHVNEQPKRYWVNRLAENGFAYDRDATGKILEHFKNNKTPYMWMTENICVFRRLTAGKEAKKQK